jgi:hypothetical protein
MNRIVLLTLAAGVVANAAGLRWFGLDKQATTTVAESRPVVPRSPAVARSEVHTVDLGAL